MGKTQQKIRKGLRRCLRPNGTGRRITTLFMSLVLVLALVAPMLPAMEVQAGTDTYTNLIPTADDDADTLAAKVVRFNGYDWYVIKDNSTAADAGSVTLLAKEPIAVSKYDKSNSSGAYGSSTVKAYLDGLTAEGGDFADVADAIKSVDLTIYKYAGTDIKENIEGIKLYLLSTEEVSALPENVRKCSAEKGVNWWLRSPGSVVTVAAFVDGEDGRVSVVGSLVRVSYGVRPALQLDLSSVIFSSGSRTFTLKTPYSDLVGSTTTVKFNAMDWYLIEDNSAAGSVTLLAKECISASKFGDTNNSYSASTVKSYLDGLTRGSGSFAAVAGAIKSVNLTDPSVTGAKLYLLSVSEAKALSYSIRQCSKATGASINYWWLRTAGTLGDGTKCAACVAGGEDAVDNTGYNGASTVLGIRPALQLDLSAVDFDSETKEFTKASVATPKFSPAAGTYDSAQSVTISTDTTGATIYYTTDGTTPTTSSTKYTAAITVDETKTIKAIAVKDGMTDSAVASATYTISTTVEEQVKTPEFSPAAGSYDSAQSVTISTETTGATIYYTTDGTTPTTSSTKYTAAITVDETKTIKAIAVKDGMTDSAVASATYTISKEGTKDAEIATWEGWRKAAATFTFDDNAPCHVTDVAPAFDKYGYKATFYVVYNWNPNWTGFQTLADNGHEIGSHSDTHPSNMKGEEASSKANINGMITQPYGCITVAYPNCNVPDKEAVLENYIVGRIGDKTSNIMGKDGPSDWTEVPAFMTGKSGTINSSDAFATQMQNAIKKNGWVVFWTHGFSGKTNGNATYSPTDFNALEGALRWANLNDKDIWVTSMRNAAMYIRERNASKIALVSSDDTKVTYSLTHIIDTSVCAYDYPLSVRVVLPDGWTSANVSQADALIESEIKDGYVYFLAVPNGGAIVVTNGDAVPKTNVTGVTLDKTTLELREGETGTLKATVAPDDATDMTVTWKSNATGVASVDSSGVVTAVKAGTAMITVTATNGTDDTTDDQTATCTVTVTEAEAPKVDVSKVTLDQSTVSLVEEETVTLTATVTPTDATDKTVTWSSDKESVATVDADGKVTAVKAGTAIITVTATNGTDDTTDDKTATCTVTVTEAEAPKTDITGITLNKTSVTVEEGKTESLTATVAPDDATDKTVTWTSSDTGIVTVDEEGKITAVAVGNAVIIVTATNGTESAGDDKTTTCIVNVVAAGTPKTDVTGVTLTKTETNIREGEIENLKYTVAPDDATDKTVTWKSSDETVATVDNSGKVTAVAAGTATITVTATNGTEDTADDKTATCEVTVTAATEPKTDITGVTLDKMELTVEEGKTETLAATVAPEDASSKDVIWSSSDETIATIDADGVVVAVKAGTATITVTATNGTEDTADDKTVTCEVTVTEAAVKTDITGITLDKTTVSLEVEQTETLTVTVEPEEATDKTLTFKSSDEKIATVDEEGKITAVAEGSTVIIVTADNGTAEAEDDKTATCIVTVTAKKTSPEIPEKGTALVKDDQGKLVYYKDGEPQKDYSGLANVDGTWYYVEKGVLSETETGFVMYEDGLFLVVEGKLLTSKSGLVQDPYNPDIWYFLADGQVQSQYTGLALYDGEWFYVNKGRLDTTIAAYIEYDGGLFYVAAGRILKEVSGLAQDPNGPDWYFLAEGQAQTQYTGLTLYDGEWFYVVDGKLAEDYTGTVEYDGSEFNVVNGMVK